MQAEAAVLHFTAAGCGDKAVEACVRGGLLRQARQLLKVQKGPLVPQQLLSLGKQLEEAGDLSEAEEAYLDVRSLPVVQMFQLRVATHEPVMT